jgi:hypothetical protein
MVFLAVGCSQREKPNVKREHSSEWWTIRLPGAGRPRNSPNARLSSRMLVLEHCNSVRHATDDDLRNFAKEHLDAGALIKPVTCGGFRGFYLHYSVDDMYQRQWWQRCGDTIVLATYTSDLEHKRKEDAVVDNILNTLKRR